MNSPCDRFCDLLPFYVAGTLSADAAARVSKHIAGCTACQASLDEWRLLGRTAHLESEVQSAELPPIGPLLEQIRRGPQLTKATGSPRISATARRVLAVAGIVACLLLGGALMSWPQFGGRLTGRLGTAPASTAGLPHMGADTGDTTRTSGGEHPGPASVGAYPSIDATRPSPVARQSTDSTPDRSALEPSVSASALASGASATRLPQAVSALATTTTGPLTSAATGSATAARPTALEATYRAPTDVPTTAADVPTTAADVPTTAADVPTTATDVPTTATDVPATAADVPATATEVPATPAELTVTPSAEPTGIITGRVLGSDGGGRAEVYVRAYSLDRPDVPAAPARTNATGAYSLPVASGLWLVGAEGAGFQTRWYRDAAEPNAAEAVEVSPGMLVSSTDLQLPANPSGAVAGRVTRPDGTAVARAVIVALRLEDPADPTDPGLLEAVAFTDADGAYRLSVRQGVYALGLRPTWSSPPVRWWDGRASLAACDLVGVDDDQVTDGVDFTLP